MQISTLWEIYPHAFLAKIKVLLKKLLNSSFDEKFFSESESIFFIFPHCDVRAAQYGNYGNLLSRIFGNNFVKVTILLKKLLNS